MENGVYATLSLIHLRINVPSELHGWEINAFKDFV